MPQLIDKIAGVNGWFSGWNSVINELMPFDTKQIADANQKYGQGFNSTFCFYFIFFFWLMYGTKQIICFYGKTKA